MLAVIVQNNWGWDENKKSRFEAAFVSVAGWFLAAARGRHRRILAVAVVAPENLHIPLFAFLLFSSHIGIPMMPGRCDRDMTP